MSSEIQILGRGGGTQADVARCADLILAGVLTCSSRRRAGPAGAAIAACPAPLQTLRNQAACESRSGANRGAGGGAFCSTRSRGGELATERAVARADATCCGPPTLSPAPQRLPWLSPTKVLSVPAPYWRLNRAPASSNLGRPRAQSVRSTLATPARGRSREDVQATLSGLDPSLRSHRRSSSAAAPPSGQRAVQSSAAAPCSGVEPSAIDAQRRPSGCSDRRR